MFTLADLLDGIKARHSLPSDYALAKKLGISRQSVSGYRLGAPSISDDVLFRIAELLEIDPAEVAAIAAAKRAKNPKMRDVWLRVAKLIHSSTLCFCLLSFSLPLYPSDASAGQYKYYVKSFLRLLQRCFLSNVLQNKPLFRIYASKQCFAHYMGSY